jgi:hypothetical protein
MRVKAAQTAKAFLTGADALEIRQFYPSGIADNYILYLSFAIDQNTNLTTDLVG